MKSTDNIKISIADTNSLYRLALKDILKSKGFDVVCVAESERDMLEQLSAHKPDILIYDFFNSSERFYITVEKIKKASLKTKLMILSYEKGSELIVSCISNGADGFCDKNNLNFEKIADSVRKIVSGETIILTNQIA